MGCFWSLYFAQSVTEAIASRAFALNSLSPLHDKLKDLVLGRDEGAQAYYVYVDSLGVQEADIVLEKNLFTENGLSLHKSELSQTVKPLGWTWRTLKLSFVTSLSCFSVPDLRYVHSTRVTDSCAHINTFRLASGQKLGPNWSRFEVC